MFWFFVQEAWKYLNDIGDGDADHLEEMAVEDVGAEVYGIPA